MIFEVRFLKLNNYTKIKNRIQSTPVGAIIFIAFLTRIIWYLLIYFTNKEGFWLYDSNGYWNIAYNYNTYGVYSLDSTPPLNPDFFRTPLYPIFIYPTLFIDMTGNIIPVFQIIIDLLSCYLLIQIVSRVTESKFYAKTAGIIYSFHIPAIIFSNFVLTESLFLFFILSFIHSVFLFISTKGYTKLFISAIFCGLCVMCKPISFYFIFPIIVFFLIQKIKWGYVLLFVLTFYAVQFPWLLRNKIETGHYFNSILGEHLINRYHAAHIESIARNVDFNEVQDERTDRFMVAFGDNPYEQPYEYAKLIEKEAYKTFWQYKWIFLKEHFKESFKFFTRPMKGYIHYQIKNVPGNKLLTYGFVGIQLLFTFASMGLITMVVLGKKKIRKSIQKEFWLLLSIVLIASQFNTMPFTDARMRFPFDGIIIILAIWSIQILRKNNASEKAVVR